MWADKEPKGKSQRVVRADIGRRFRVLGRSLQGGGAGFGSCAAPPVAMGDRGSMGEPVTISRRGNHGAAASAGRRYVSYFAGLGDQARSFMDGQGGRRAGRERRRSTASPGLISQSQAGRKAPAGQARLQRSRPRSPIHHRPALPSRRSSQTPLFPGLQHTDWEGLGWRAAVHTPPPRVFSKSSLQRSLLLQLRPFFQARRGFARDMRTPRRFFPALPARAGAGLRTPRIRGRPHRTRPPACKRF